MTPRAATLAAYSVRLYQWMLSVYPAPFRQEYGHEMAQVFGDLCRNALRRAGPYGMIALWMRVLSDLLVSVVMERTKHMSRKLTPTTLAAIVLLLPTMVFLFIMFTRFVLGIEGLYNAWDRFYMNPNLRTLNWMLEGFMVLAPFVALALAAVPVMRIQWGQEEGNMVASISVRINPVTATIIVVAVLVIAIIMGYGFVENFQPI